MSLVQKLAGSKWQCKNTKDGSRSELDLGNTGDASGLTGRGRGRWGSMNDPTLGRKCPVYSCIFIDLGWAGQKHEARHVDGSPETLTVIRHTDLEEVAECKRQ